MFRDEYQGHQHRDVPIDNLPFKVAVAAFDETVVVYNIRAIIRNDLGGFAGAAERRGIDDVGNGGLRQRCGLQSFGEQCRWRSAQYRRRLEPVLDIPVGLTVADE